MQPIAKDSPVLFATPSIERLPVRCLVAATSDQWIFNFPSLACLKSNTTALSILPAPENHALLKQLIASDDDEFLSFVHRNLAWSNSCLRQIMHKHCGYETPALSDRVQFLYLIPPWDSTGNGHEHLRTQLLCTEHSSDTVFHYDKSEYRLIQSFSSLIEKANVVFEDVINACKSTTQMFVTCYANAARVAPDLATMNFLLAFYLDDNFADGVEQWSVDMYVFARTSIPGPYITWTPSKMFTPAGGAPISLDKTDQEPRTTEPASVFDWFRGSTCQIV